ncbi:MAG: hypothetical protein IMW89_08115 [Ktedonobacteraceae bacterium]|nr:hypothetical protein [Ktedonobacteraceae bacterium]
MPSQICIKTDKSLQQLAAEIQQLLTLPSVTENSFAGQPYYQFEMFGILALIHRAEEEGLDPEVMDYPYCLDLQMTFTEHELDTDALEYQLQPYYAQLLAFHLGVETAYHEKQKIGSRWRIRYRFCRKNPVWNEAILYGEEGWQPAVLSDMTSEWRYKQPVI